MPDAKSVVDKNLRIGAKFFGSTEGKRSAGANCDLKLRNLRIERGI